VSGAPQPDTYIKELKNTMKFNKYYEREFNFPPYEQFSAQTHLHTENRKILNRLRYLLYRF